MAKISHFVLKFLSDFEKNVAIFSNFVSFSQCLNFINEPGFLARKKGLVLVMERKNENSNSVQCAHIHSHWLYIEQVLGIRNRDCCKSLDVFVHTFRLLSTVSVISRPLCTR